ncbi:diaminobutyrate--2-oxoglutarate transaminase [Leucobacter sp. W1038]|uniref:diaminobutyrate--2-oxoglutarate transaminase n=1 Tax=Leucobacter sp. W1038 TaxID=3438281 RepID=UPI003D97AF10
MSVIEQSDTSIFTSLESQVRSYSRSWPVVFDRALGSTMYDESGNGYLDFFAGAGALNYGHSNPLLKKALIDYLSSDRVIHSLDMFTTARRDFLRAFDEIILKPRELDYRVIFPGPGGTNAVEAALKLARKVTGRESIVNFTNAFHGMTLGALSVTGNALKRGGAGVPLVHATPMPFDDYFQQDYPDFFYFKRLLADSGSGLNIPAAVIVESVQGEGGINAARAEWLRGLSELCQENGILLILDDVQMGCGRTGGFFSFEEAGIKPDMVCLSKSISGSGLPLALTLVKPELDIWEPGEHNGTFRGIAPAFETARVAIEEYWQDRGLEESTLAKGLRVESRFNAIAASHEAAGLVPKGRGLARGLQMPSGELASRVSQIAFENRLLVETSGPEGEVVKVMPPLTIADGELDRGLDIVANAVAEALAEHGTG